MAIVGMTGLSYPAVRLAIDLHEEGGYAALTVSYTHLDVYKRQLFGPIHRGVSPLEDAVLAGFLIDKQGYADARRTAMLDGGFGLPFGTRIQHKGL